MRNLLAFVGAALILGGCVQERTGVSQNELPESVRATIEKNSRPGKINSIIRETSDKTVTYKANVTHEGKRWEVAVDSGGDLVYKKER